MDKRILAAMLLMLLPLIALGCQHSRETAPPPDTGYQKVRMVMAVTGTDKGLNALVARKIASLVAEESGGNVSIEVYTNDRLAGGNTNQGVEMMANGSVDLAAYTSGTLSMLDPRLAVGTLPWTFRSYQDARRIIDSTGGAYYEKILAQQGLVYLGSTHNGMRQVSNNQHPIRKPEDLQGLRIRVLNNESSLQFFRLLDAYPVPMNWSEVPAAIQQGIINGHDSGFFTSNSSHLDKLLGYVTKWNYSYENYIFIANSKTFNHLDARTQELLRKKTREACDWGRDMLEKNEESLQKKFIASGVEITEPTPEELHAFQEKTRPLIEHFKEIYGPEACAAFHIQ